MQITVDHITICGANLASLQSAFAALGLGAQYGGPHANRITHMALLGFADGSYLELIAPYEGNGEGSPWQSLMLRNAGPGAWAAGSSDLHTEVARLRAAGVEARAPTAGSRLRPDGKLLQWETASVGPGSAGALLPFMIQDRTPRAWRVDPSIRLPHSAITGVAAVVLGVADLTEAARLFRRAYGWPMPLREDSSEFGAQLAYFPGTPVILASARDEHSWLARRTTEFGDLPAAFLLKTANLEQAAEQFPLGGGAAWFGRQLAWLHPAQRFGIRLGLLQP